MAKEERVTALGLAVQTVQNTQHFSVAQVINTADQYEKFISDGIVPPLMTLLEEDGNAEVGD